jgi:hypothetical protein
MNNPLAEVSATVHSAPDAVASLLIGQLRPQARGHHGDVEVDHTRHHIIVQGGWWYRGEYTVYPDPAGSRIIYRVYNVARPARWAVPLVDRFFIGFRHRAQKEFTALIDQIAGEARARG